MLGRMQWQKSSVETKHFVTAGFKLLKKQIYTFVSICFPLQPFLVSGLKSIPSTDK